MKVKIKKSKVYMNQDSYDLCKLNGETFEVLSGPSKDYEHIDLADYVDIEQTIRWHGSYDWEYTITNNSDRPVQLYVYMYVDDSQGDANRETWEEELMANQSMSFYIESAGSYISYCRIEVEASAENADDLEYAYQSW